MTKLPRLLAALFFTFGALLSTTQGAPGPIPSGEYNCHKISGSSLIGLGTLEIKGETYRTDSAAPFKPFSIAADGTIAWSAGIDFLPENWKLGVSKYEGPNRSGQPRLTIRYTSASGNAEVIDAVKEK